MTDLLHTGYRGPHALSNRGWLDFVARLERREEIALVRSLTSGNSRALDVGGGTGELTRAVAVQLGGCTAVEPHTDRATRLRETGGDIEILPGSAESLPFDDGMFDVVLANWILPYVTDLEGAVREIARVTDLSHPEAKVVFIGGAPDNELVALLNETCVPVAGEPPDDQGYLLAVAAEVLARNGFSRFTSYRTEAALHFPESDPEERLRAAARTLVNFWYEDHPAAPEMLTAVEPALRRHFARRPHAVGDQGVVLVARP
ncbi:class I SAM-dependent methyltransferase [Lentzea sp. NPDC005914]|uniref:class I SAM-dependent methyltransferase n=1 Tax=Lentzea sp. NPDC005914 TaxID=3154572 RepID=UPI0033D76709